jgi:hypothetical protein
LLFSTSTPQQLFYHTLVAAYKFNGIDRNAQKNLKEFSSWNLHSINTEWYKHQFKIPFQPFYITNLTYSHMTRSIMQNTELLVFPQIVGYQSSLRE